MRGRNRARMLIAAMGALSFAFAPSADGQAKGPPIAATPASARSATVDDLAAKLVDRFVDPEVGKRYAAMLRANSAAGKYDSIGDDAVFAKQVTADLQAVAFDGHLKLFPAGGVAAKGGQRPAPKDLPKTVEASARLTRDIAYIRLGSFLGGADGIAAIKQFLADNSDAKTLIIDVRTHIGGGLDEMNAMFPYLFDKETVLVDMDTRAAVDGPENAGPGLRTIAGPEGVVRREHFVVPADEPRPLAKAKIYVLASGRTGSAGEHFVLSMRRTHRATVIGDTTYGAGNYGGQESIVGGFSAFIPVGRTFDPDTGKGWDYVGIAPDVAVPAAQAMVEALVRSGLSRADAEKLSAQYGPSAEAVASLRKAPASVPGI